MSFHIGESEELKKLKKQLTQQELLSSRLAFENESNAGELNDLRETVRNLHAKLAEETSRCAEAEARADKLKADRDRQSLQISNLEQSLANVQRHEQEGQKGRRLEDVERDRALALQAREGEEERKQLADKVKLLEQQLRTKDEEMVRVMNDAAGSSSRRGGRHDPVARAIALENELMSVKAENERLTKAAAASATGPNSPARLKASTTTTSFFGADGMTPVKPSMAAGRRPRRSSIGSSNPMSMASTGKDALQAEISSLKTALDAAQADQAAVEARAAKAQKDALKATNEAIAMEQSKARELAGLQERIDDLKDELRWKEDELKSTRAELEEMERRASGGGDDGRQSAAAKAAMAAELSQAQEASRIAQEKVSALEGRCAELQSSLEEVTDRAARTEEALASANAAARETSAPASPAQPVEAPTNEASATSGPSESRLLRDLRRDLTATQAERDALRKEIGDLEDEIEQLQAQAGGSTQGDSPAPAALAQELEAARQKVSALEAVVDENRVKLEEAQQARDEATQSASASAEAVRAAEDKVQTLEAELQQARKEAEAAKDDAKTLQATVDTLSQAKEASEHDSADLQLRLQEALAVSQAATSSDAEVSQLRSSLEAAEKARDSLQEQLDVASRTVEESEVAAAETLERVIALEEGLKQAREHSAAAGQVETLQQQLDEAAAQTKDLRSSLEKLELERLGAEEGMKQARLDCQAREAELAAVRLELEAAQSLSQDTSAAERAEQLNAQLEVLSSELEAKEADFEEVQTIAEKLASELQQREDDVASLRQDMHELHLELDVLRSTAASAPETERRLDQLHVQLSKRDEQIKNLLEALRKREADLTTAKRHLRTIGARIRRSFGYEQTAGDSSIVDTSLTFAQDADETSMSPVKRSMHRPSLAPGGAALEASISADLLDEVEHIRDCVKEAERRLDFLRVENTFKIRSLEKAAAEGQAARQARADALAALQELKAKQGALYSLERRKIAQNVARQKVEWLTRRCDETSKTVDALVELESTAAVPGPSSESAVPSPSDSASQPALVAELQARILRRNEQIGLHQRQLQQSGAKLRLAEESAERAADEAEKLTARNEELDGELQISRKAVEDVSTERTQLQEKLASLSAELEEQRLLAEKHAEALDAVAALNDAQANIRKLEEQLETRERELAEATITADNVRIKLGQIEEQRRLLEEELAERDEAMRAGADAEPKLREELESARKEVEALTGERDAIRAMNEANVEERQRQEAAASEIEDRLQQAVAELDAKASALAELEAAHVVLVEEKEQAVASAAALQAQLDEAVSAGKRIDEETRCIMKELEKQREAAGEAHAAEAQKLLDDLKRAQEGESQAKERIQQLQGALAEAEGLKERSEKLETEMAQIQEQLTLAREQHSAAVADAQRAEESHRVELAKMEDSLASKNANTVELDELRAKLQKRESQFAELEAALLHRNGQLKELDEQYWNLKEELGELQEQAERSREVQKSVEELKGEIGAITQARDAAVAELEQVRMEVSRLAAARQEQENAVEELGRQLTDARSESHVAGAKAQQAERELDQVRRALRESHEERERLAAAHDKAAPSADVAALEAQIEELENELQAKAQELEENDSKMIIYLKESKKLAARNKSLQAKNDALTAQLSEATAASTLSPVTTASARTAYTSTPSSTSTSRKRGAPEDGPSQSSAKAEEAPRARAVYQPATATAPASVSPVAARNFTPVRRGAPAAAARPTGVEGGMTRSTSNPSELVAERLSPVKAATSAADEGTRPTPRWGTSPAAGERTPSAALGDRSNAAPATQKPQAADLMAKLAKFRAPTAARPAATTNKAAPAPTWGR